jgi:hypothetical protein
VFWQSRPKSDSGSRSGQIENATAATATSREPGTEGAKEPYISLFSAFVTNLPLCICPVRRLRSPATNSLNHWTRAHSVNSMLRIRRRHRASRRTCVSAFPPPLPPLPQAHQCFVFPTRTTEPTSSSEGTRALCGTNPLTAAVIWLVSFLTQTIVHTSYCARSGLSSYPTNL